MLLCQAHSLNHLFKPEKSAFLYLQELMHLLAMHSDDK